MKSLLRNLQNRISSLIVRGFVSLLNDAAGVQVVQLGLRAGEITSDVEHPQEFGFSSHCPAGSESVAAFLMGDKDHGLSLLQFHRSKRKRNLLVGESCVYNDNGCWVYLKNSQKIDITAAVEVACATLLLSVTGDITAQGNITAVGDVSDSNATTPTMAAMRALFNAHKHSPTGTVPTTQM